MCRRRIGYISNDMPAKVLELFDQMPMKPDRVTITLLFNACGKLADARAVKLGKDVLGQVPAVFLENHVLVNSAIDMLMRFGDVPFAERLFSQMKKRDAYAYGTMLNGYKLNDEPRKCLRLFDEVKEQNLVVDEPIAVSLIGACSQIGLVSRCRHVLQHIPARLQSSRRLKTVSIDMWVSASFFYPSRSPMMRSTVSPGQSGCCRSSQSNLSVDR